MCVYVCVRATPQGAGVKEQHTTLTVLQSRALSLYDGSIERHISLRADPRCIPGFSFSREKQMGGFFRAAAKPTARPPRQI